MAHTPDSNPASSARSAQAAVSATSIKSDGGSSLPPSNGPLQFFNQSMRL